MYDLKNTTIAFIREDQFYSKKDFVSSVTVKDYLSFLGKIKTANSLGSEVAAFYLIDQTLFELEKQYPNNTELPPAQAQLALLCRNEAIKISNKVFAFTVLACASEISRIYAQQTNGFYDYIKTGYDPALADVIQHKNKNVYNSFANPKAVVESCSHMSVEKFLAGMSAIFSSGKWHFGAGGTLWSDIAKCYLNFVRGASSFHETTDLAFSLCHDRGSYFDRGGFIQNPKLYSSCDLTNLYELLDVQASGQIPQYLRQHHNGLKIVSENPVLKNILSSLELISPEITKVKLDLTKINKAKAARDAATQQKWQYSQAHHANIAGVTAQKEKEEKQPPKEKIDDILIRDFADFGFINPSNGVK